MAGAGVAPIRSLVNVGNGVADLVFMPLEEYQRDQRVMRGYGQARYSL
jgi:autophagy-related protein 2